MGAGVSETKLAHAIKVLEGALLTARRGYQYRVESAESWRSGDDASHREAHAMAERQSGRKMQYQNAEQREHLAKIDERIGARNLAEAEGLDYALGVLRAHFERAQP